jgi:transcriptional regulator with XRE-family HTH domain
LRRLRQEKSVSQEELAHRAQVNRNYVGMVEREEYSVSVDTLEKLATALGVDPIEFLRTDK